MNKVLSLRPTQQGAEKQRPTGLGRNTPRAARLGSLLVLDRQLAPTKAERKMVRMEGFQRATELEADFARRTRMRSWFACPVLQR